MQLGPSRMEQAYDPAPASGAPLPCRTLSTRPVADVSLDSMKDNPHATEPSRTQFYQAARFHTGPNSATYCNSPPAQDGQTGGLKNQCSKVRHRPDLGKGTAPRPRAKTEAVFEVAAYDQGAHVTYLGTIGSSHIGHKENHEGTPPACWGVGSMTASNIRRALAKRMQRSGGNFPALLSSNGLTDDFHHPDPRRS